MDEPILPQFKMLQLESDDGTSNPIDHLNNFRAIMLLHKATDSIFYRAFPSTKRNATYYWYSSLQASLIGSFERLDQYFVVHFVTG